MLSQVIVCEYQKKSKMYMNNGGLLPEIDV